MTKPTNLKTASSAVEIHAQLESAYFLPSLHTIDAGVVLLKGWAFSIENSSSGVICNDVELALQMRGRSLGQTRCNESRMDVVQSYSGAPAQCGFELIVPISELYALASLSISYVLNGKILKIESVSVQVVESAQQLLPEKKQSPLRLKKLNNYLLNERERLFGSSTLYSKPVHLYIDPNFSCQLNCPHCDSDMLRENGYNMANLKLKTLDSLLSQYGETLISVSLTGWGEPLLNLQFPELVRRLKKYEIWVETSTNLSLPLSNERIEELVSCGLDSMRLSIDGATQTVYERYRKNGNLDLVLENVRRIVACKKEHGTRTPFLKWQYLLFPWNTHEVLLAESLARSLEVDLFYTMPGATHARGPKSITSRAANESSTPLSAEARQSFMKLRAQRQRNFGFFGCDALYRSMAVQSNGLVMPCCYVAEPKDAIGWADDCDLFNSPIQVANRDLFNKLDDPYHGAHDPCLHCPMISTGYYSSLGYVAGPVGFFSAYRYLVKDEFLF
jgi:MoaA/NifB/PqqE/SkfB family radical SAM enzyme